MQVREFMTPNPKTVSSQTPVVQVARLLKTYKVRRLPVVDEGKLVGLIGERAVTETLPSSATTLTGKEMADSLSRILTRNIMRKEVITATPDMSAESALALAQRHGVGSLVVVNKKDGKVIGIVTTNDFIHRIVNPLLGLGKPGVRLQVFDCIEARHLREVASMIENRQMGIEAFHLDECGERNSKDLIIQVDVDDPAELISDLTARGYVVETRERLFFNPDHA